MNRVLRWCWVALLIGGGVGRLAAIETPKTSKNVDAAASWLYTQGRLEEALDVSQSWLKSHPDDPQILFRDAFVLSLKASLESDTYNAVALRKRAYAEAEHARKLGCKDALLDMLLGAIDAEGRDLGDPRVYSTIPAAMAEMQQGEAAFVRHDLDTALACYHRALEIDPHAYMAALYIGDVYFNQNKQADAVIWFRQAIAIDPDRETAHRYLGDAYNRLGKLKEARAEYIEAVIGAPYERIPREVLGRFGERNGRPPHRANVQPPAGTVTMKDGKVEVAVKPNGGAFAVAYAIARAAWFGKDREKYFPKTAKPRHSLYEECAGLRLLISTGSDLANNKDLDEPSKKLLPSIAVLKKIDDAGLLEAYVLLDQADAGIAQDYATYRALHRDLLRRYIDEVWFGDLGQ